MEAEQGDSISVSEIERVVNMLGKTEEEVIALLLSEPHCDRMFLAPYKGKSSLDGMTGVRKNEHRNAEVKGNVRCNNASDLHAFLLAQEEKRQKARARLPGPLSQYAEPKHVGRNSHYAIDQEDFFLFAPVDIELARAKQVEIDTVAGVRSHFHYEARGVGVLGRRWLTCVCVECEKGTARDETKCVDAEYVGLWVEQRICSHGRDRGVAKRTQEAQKRVQKLISELGVGMLVAIYNDEGQNPFWLGRVLEPAFVVSTTNVLATRNDVFVCPGTRYEFKSGAHVFKVQYYDRLSKAHKHERLYTQVDDEDYYIFANTLRSAGADLEAAFVKREASVSTRRVSTRGAKDVWELSADMQDAVLALQRDVHKDFE